MTSVICILNFPCIADEVIIIAEQSRILTYKQRYMFRDYWIENSKSNSTIIRPTYYLSLNFTASVPIIVKIYPKHTTVV
jgi:hypothetical protein